MGKLVRLRPRKARRIKDTVYTDRGSRLSDPAGPASDKGIYFLAAILAVATFLIVFNW